MNLTLITSRERKQDVAKKFLPDIERKNLELKEIQSTNYFEIAEHKLKAGNKIKGNVLVDDAAFELSCLNGHPGPYAKDFVNSLGIQKIHELVKSLKDNKARRICTLGLRYKGKYYFFQGETKGTIVKPSKNTKASDFDRIFIPKGYKKPMSDLPQELKDKISHRAKAYQKLIVFLKSKGEL